MSAIIRSRPRRPAWFYPVGSALTLRDGRTFTVTVEPRWAWSDPSEGNGGGEWITVTSKRFWRDAA